MVRHHYPKESDFANHLRFVIKMDELRAMQPTLIPSSFPTIL
jgi:hypothetical protein